MSNQYVEAYNSLRKSEKQELRLWVCDVNDAYGKYASFDQVFLVRDIKELQNDDEELTLTDSGKEFIEYYITRMQDFLSEEELDPSALHLGYREHVEAEEADEKEESEHEEEESDKEDEEEEEEEEEEE